MADAAVVTCAIGRLAPGGPWIGLRRTEHAWGLVVGEAEGQVRPVPTAGAKRDRLRLIAAASAHFAEAMADPPPDLDATQADIADLLRWLAAGEVEPRVAARAAAALDGIDDGLAGDAVVSLLAAYAAALDPETTKQADPVDLLRDAYRASVAR
jgi:hypothetical protein